MAGKDVGLRIRIERALRKDFLEACESAGTPAAQVLREFMRDFIMRKKAIMPRRNALRQRSGRA